MMQISIQLQPDAARELQDLRRAGSPATPGRLRATPVLAALEKLGLQLEPVHPGTDDPSLALHFTVEVPDQRTADRVIQALRQIKVVDAVYLKPADELP
jgi:hypothetical protein